MALWIVTESGDPFETSRRMRVPVSVVVHGNPPGEAPSPRHREVRADPSDAASRRQLSSLTIVAVPALSDRLAPVGSDSVRLNVSLFSLAVSPVMFTLTVLVVSPAANVTLLDVMAVPPLVAYFTVEDRVVLPDLTMVKVAVVVPELPSAHVDVVQREVGGAVVVDQGGGPGGVGDDRPCERRQGKGERLVGLGQPSPATSTVRVLV